MPTAGQGSAFPLLGSPIRLAGLTVPNRTVMAAMSSGLSDVQGRVTDDLVAYYRARAAGGTGLVVVEFSGVNRRFGRAELTQSMIDTAEHVAGHGRLAKAIRDAGGRAALQLHSPGQHADRRTVDGLPYAPSVEVSRRDATVQTTRMVSDGEIEELIADFGRAAERAMDAGYEAIEIHAAHGYLPMAFLSPLRNRRDDRWGGDAERRLAFPLAIIRAVKAVLGPDRPLSYRISSTDFLPGGLSLDDMKAIVPRLVAAGLDAVHVSSGAIEGTLDRTVDPMSADEGWRFAHARAIRDVAGVPVIAVGPARWPATAEKALAAGDVDMVALGRPLLADPEWPRKAIAGEVGSIRPCTNCNWCFDRVLRHETIGCAENPAAGHELRQPVIPAGRGRRAIVVGGGPGGMAAALDLAEAGFSTELIEARPALGGGLTASAAPPLKDKLQWYLDHLLGRLATSDVTLTLGQAATGEGLRSLGPDLVVLATGALADPWPFEVRDASRVLSAYDILAGDRAAPAPGSHPTLVYGGGETGCETAEYLAARGHTVTLVTRSPAKDLARSAEAMYRKHLRARLQSNPQITVQDETTVVLVDGRIASLVRAGLRREDEVAWVVVAQGRTAEAPLAEPLRRAAIPFAIVGDADHIGRIGDAVHAARQAVASLAALIEESRS